MRKFLYLGLLLLSACGQQHDTGKNPSGGAFQGDIDAYRKARQVNQQIQRGADRERRQIDQQGGG